ncbi:MAG: hypothetical protein ACK5Q5_01310 [Planctomycetaceae bacterium]
MRVTRYDRVSSFMMSLIFGTVLAVGFVIMQWYAIKKPPPLELVPLEMVVGGGYEDGNPDETLQVESPEEVNPNASPVQEEVEQQELMEVLDNVVELSDRATQQMQQVEAKSESVGTPGSAVGTGGRPLGSGGGAGGGIPAYQRWYIRFNESSSTDYAKQLDHFGIELAVFYPGSGKIAYAKNFAGGSPTVTRKDKWEDDRIYFKWSGGPREKIDRELLKKAGIETSGGQIYQFYPNQTIQLLGTIEQNYANRSAKEIRRTYFVVTPQGGGYSFTVTRQTYLR